MNSRDIHGNALLCNCGYHDKKLATIDSEQKKVETGGSAAYTGAPNLKVRQPIPDNEPGLSITGFTGCNHMKAKMDAKPGQHQQ